MWAGRRLTVTAAVLMAGLIALTSACAPASTSNPSPASSQAPPARTAASQPAPPIELTVYAAASLRNAFGELVPAYEGSHPAVTLTVSFGSSAALRAQIEQGAPADVFVSADTANVEKLIASGHGDGPPTDFASNALALVVPEDNPANVSSPYDVARLGLKIVAAGDDVPLTRYVHELLENLESLRAAALADFIPAYERNVVSREDNASAVLAKIELGEGDAAFVYRTDASAGRSIRAIDIPPAANVRVTYAATTVTESARHAAAADFLAWLGGRDAQAILGRLGFGPAD